jgi:excisionase family DNA binding protein
MDLQRMGLSPNEAAKVAGIGRTLLKREIRNRRLIARKVGRRTVIMTDDLAAWLRALPKAGKTAGDLIIEGNPPRDGEAGKTTTNAAAID